ncbi:MAG: hypothetical protein ACQRW7_11470 [Caulobacterales bacterium]|uniref:hypothetical protein n=1 Tax=Glycocaulis sp. TaxID=1969725 RepID=UPI003FA00926
MRVALGIFLSITFAPVAMAQAWQVSEVVDPMSDRIVLSASVSAAETIQARNGTPVRPRLLMVCQGSIASVGIDAIEDIPDLSVWVETRADDAPFSARSMERSAGFSVISTSRPRQVEALLRQIGGADILRVRYSGEYFGSRTVTFDARGGRVAVDRIRQLCPNRR